MAYTIRKATITDCNELSYLKHKMWETTYRGIYPDDRIDKYDYEKNKYKFLKIINNPDIELYVVEDKNKLIGYMDFGIPIRPFKDYKQEIGLLYILKEYQGKGIGTELFDIAYNGIKSGGYKEFFVSCNKYNILAHKFYEKMGGIQIHRDDDMEDKSIPQVVYLYKINN